jgi:DNA repair ATPase RecN
MHPEGFIAIVGFFATLLTALITLGPIGRAMADRVRSKGAGGSIAALQDQLDEVITRLDDVQRQLGDMAERQDFTERMLAKARERGLLEAPK